MDSGNSGSMHSSSSGGEEEFDSRAESISAFLSHDINPLSHVSPLPHLPPPPSSEHHHNSASSSMFDPLLNYFGPLSSASRSPAPALLTNPNSLLSLDVWSKNLRSEPNCTDLGGFMASCSSPTQQFCTKQTQSRTTFPSVQIPPGAESAARVSISGSNANDQSNNTVSSSSGGGGGHIGRNPKKRSRASRRAPTTVLTTDTTNFRAMVQEFTGIPAPPFACSPFSRSRLDLLGTAASTLRSAASHLDLSPPPSYLLRPFAQRVQPPSRPPETPFLFPPPTSTSLPTPIVIDAIAPNSTTKVNSSTTANNATTSSSTSVNYQIPTELGLLKQQQPQNNLLNINVQTPVLNFHSLLQDHHSKYPLLNSSTLGTTKTSQESFELPSNEPHLKIGGLEDIGLGHGLQNMVSSSSSDTPLHRSDINPANRSDGVGCSNEGGGHQGLLRSINGSYNDPQRVTNGKVNYSASSSDLRGDKGPENMPTRSECMVESWICSSE